MLKLLSSSRQFHTHLTASSPLLLRPTITTTESQLFKALKRGSIGSSHGGIIQRLFFCSDSSSKGGGNGEVVEVEVRGSESEATDGAYSSAIVPTNPRAEDYLTVLALPLPHRPLFPGFYMPIFVKVTLRWKRETFMVHLKPKIFPGQSLKVNNFSGNKRSLSQFTAPETTIPITTITELISKQHWSTLKTCLQKTDPNTILHQLINSGADPQLTLSYFTWLRQQQQRKVNS